MFAASSLAGFTGLRAELLVSLKKRQPLTARELGDEFGLTANALRRHLKGLEEADLVRYRPVVRGVGAPVYAYSLSDAGEALFPRSYEPALEAALETVAEDLGDDGVMRVFARRWQTRFGESLPLLKTLAPAERAQLLAELLSAEGYMAEAAMQSPTRAELKVFNCGLHGLPGRYPQACQAEVRFLEQALGATLERREHIAGGCNACTYHVKFAEEPAPAAASTRSTAAGAQDYTGSEQEKA
jgi:DeoR family suf operon transcriptional repressor